MDENKKTGTKKMVAGLLLMATGVIGALLGRSLKSAMARLAILTFSIVSFGTGLYLFVAGVTDNGIGVVGQTQLRKDLLGKVERREAFMPPPQTATYPGPIFFEKSLRLALAHDPALKDLRRLRYQCPDDSEGFTIYVTRLGIFGIPENDVVCADGFTLLKYDPSKGFVMESPRS